MSAPEQTASTETPQPGWFHELADANAMLPTWLLIVFLIAGLAGLGAGLFSVIAG